MLHYERNGVYEGIGDNKNSALKECDICHFWYILNQGFTFQLYPCNEYHDLLMLSIKLNNIAILNICVITSCCNINGITKNDAVNVLRKTNLTEERGVLQNIITVYYHVKTRQKNKIW